MTQGANPVVKDAAENTGRASQIVGAASVVKEPARKKVEAWERPEPLKEIV